MHQPDKFLPLGRIKVEKALLVDWRCYVCLTNNHSEIRQEVANLIKQLADEAGNSPDYLLTCIECGHLHDFNLRTHDMQLFTLTNKENQA